jgi:hypothetical protein
MARILQREYDHANFGKFEKVNNDYFLKVINADSEGNFITPFAPPEYDEIELTYITSGNGTGEVETVIYKLDSVTQATLTLSYDANNRLSGVVKS